MSISIGELAADGVLSFGDGYRTKRSEHGKPGFRILRVADIAHGIVFATGTDYVAEQRSGQIGGKLAHPGDVLLTTKGTVGRVAIMPPLDEQVVYSPQLCYFRVHDAGRLDPRWLSYWFRSADFVHQASHRANNTDMAAYINLADIRSLRLPATGVTEQRGIAEVLGALDDKIAANAKLATTSEQLLAAMLAATGIDREPLPGEGKALTDFVDLNPKLHAPSEDEPVYVDMQRLPTTSMHIGSWTHRAAKGGARFQNGDTLLARITPCLENRKTGYVDFLNEGQVGLGSTEYIVMRGRLGRSKALPFFLATSDRFREFAIRHMVGTSGRQRLAARDLAGYELTNPEPEALRRFEASADSLLPRVGSATQESSSLADMRDALLPQLMSGKIRVKDAERVVEGVV